jgi:hypothetical protein
MTRSYINRSNVHWRIIGRPSCGTIICGGINNIYGCKGKERHWGGSTTIHRSVGDDINTTKGDGDQGAWVKCCNKEKTRNHGHSYILK